MRDFIVFAGYVVASLAVSFGLPMVAGIMPARAALVGLLFLLTALIVHEASVRRRQQNRLEFGFEGLTQVLSEINRALEHQEKRLDMLAREIKEKSGKLDDFDSVRSEVNVLQKLVSRLSGVPVPTRRKKAVPLARIPEDKEKLLEMVREGLSSDRVDLYAQPIVTLPQRKGRFYECYARIRNRKNEIILPQHYVTLAEKKGFIAAIDNMLLFRCIQLIRHTYRKNENTGFFCNLSPHTLKDAHFFGDFIAFISENPKLARALVFEVDQAILDDRDARVEKLLKKLTSVGCRLCMQAVTTLNFDVAHLKALNVRFIKIRGDVLAPFIKSDTPAVDLVKMKFRLDREKIDLIVQNIEAEKDLLDLLDFNIDFGQGYLFGEPELIQSAEDTLNRS